MKDHEQVFVRLRSQTTGEWFAPADLRPALVQAVEDKGSSLSDVVIEILAGHYSVPFQSSGRKTTPLPDAEELNLRLPVSLFRVVAVAAASSPRTVQREIIAVLCGHFGLPLPGEPAAAAA